MADEQSCGRSGINLTMESWTDMWYYNYKKIGNHSKGTFHLGSSLVATTNQPLELRVWYFLLNGYVLSCIYFYKLHMTYCIKRNYFNTKYHTHSSNGWLLIAIELQPKWNIRLEWLPILIVVLPHISSGFHSEVNVTPTTHFFASFTSLLTAGN